MSDSSEESDAIEKQKKGEELFQKLLALQMNKKKKKKKQNQEDSKEISLDHKETHLLNQEGEKKKQKENNQVNENKNEKEKEKEKEQSKENEDKTNLINQQFSSNFINSKTVNQLLQKLKETREESDELLKSNKFLSTKLREMGLKIETLEESERTLKRRKQELNNKQREAEVLLNEKTLEFEDVGKQLVILETKIKTLTNDLTTLRKEKNEITQKTVQSEEILLNKLNEQTVVLKQCQEKLTNDPNEKQKRWEEKLNKLLGERQKNYENQLNSLKSRHEIEISPAFEKIQQLEITRGSLLSQIEITRNETNEKINEQIAIKAKEYQKIIEEKDQIITSLQSNKIQIQNIIKQLEEEYQEAKNKEQQSSDGLIKQKKMKDEAIIDLNQQIENQKQISNGLTIKKKELELKLKNVINNSLQSNNNYNNSNNSKENENEKKRLSKESLQLQKKNKQLQKIVESLNKEINNKNLKLKQEKQKFLDCTSNSESYKQQIYNLKITNQRLKNSLSSEENILNDFNQKILLEEKKFEKLQIDSQTMNQFLESQTKKIEYLTNIIHFLQKDQSGENNSIKIVNNNTVNNVNNNNVNINNSNDDNFNTNK
ncbi:hypothetical protein M0813_01594 [Anaeramoeba flamelloides]|uniref:Uncharacterized protein n=1 Tax=Anaeramoeba flamelloides TaxID=1746091 RepID=A0ABQ8Z4J9_9EUKA|nr:hypothetical protein M0813_01594 [Anaeramoeba flamelloides]